jgi:predicted GH43/DUF377 family glycosyl hydrolase
MFNPDPSRIIARFSEASEERSAEIIKQVLVMPEWEVTNAVNKVLRSYSTRHRNISRIFEKYFARLSPVFEKLGINIEELSPLQKSLLGSYFTMEYSIESAAFFNPSIVEHPDQTDVRLNEKRVIFSFRATGEGHISSIVFRSGIIDKHNNFMMEPVGKMLAEAEVIKQNFYNKSILRKNLDELQEQTNSMSASFILDSLSENFTYTELLSAIEAAKSVTTISEEHSKAINQLIWLASSHYEIIFSMDSAISERVIFPITAIEQKGIEDARFVKFVYDNGEVTYFASYTAYDGMGFLPKLISTKDFYTFKVLPTNGEIVRNKGMALFPRKVNGKFAMLCRIDGVNNYIAFSDNINVWREAQLLQQPKYSWEMVKIGNAGSPIETEEGWLVITHAVGSMREYCLGASLFRLDDPTIEIGRLRSPLLVPNETEREGYVPNVVYSCGSMLHNNDLIIPYAMSDHSSTYATLDLRQLLNVLKNTASADNK